MTKKHCFHQIILQININTMKHNKKCMKIIRININLSKVIVKMVMNKVELYHIKLNNNKYSNNSKTEKIHYYHRIVKL